jgi:hypothetical protein
MSVLSVVVSERAVITQLGRPSWPMYTAPALAAAIAVVLSAVAGARVSDPLWLAAIVKAGICGAVFAAALLLFDRRAAFDMWQAVRRAWRPA